MIFVWSLKFYHKPVRSCSILAKKKARFYLGFGVSQTPIYTITYEGEETTDKGSVQSAEEDVEITVREHGEQSEQATEDAFGVDIVTDNPEAEKEAQIYLIVKRDDGGEIQKGKQITLEEVMEKLLAFQN